MSKQKAQLPLVTSHRVELLGFEDTRSEEATEAQGELLS